MLQVFKRVRIGRLFFGSFAAFVVVLLLAFSWISYSLTSSELADNAAKYQQDLLNELNKQLLIQLNSIEQMSNSRVNEITGFDPQQSDLFERNLLKTKLVASLASITYSTSMVQSIYLYMNHPSPVDLQSPVKLLDLQQINEEKWYGAIENNDSAWIGEHTIQTNVGPLSVISYVRKVYNNSGIYYGMLLLNVKASEIQSLIRGETEGRSRVLFDAGGKAITAIGETNVSDKEMNRINQIKMSSGSIHLPAVYGKDELLVWSKSPAEWVLVEITPWKTIIHGSVHLATVLLIVGISAIIVALFFTLWISGQFIKPIKMLVALMGKFPAKGTALDLPVGYTNEFGNLFNGYRRQMERIEELVDSLKSQHKRQREAEIQALQAMINPHFLYNTLDQLNWLAIDSGQEKISKILSLMGKMFRIGLSNGETLIPIADEIDLVECYLQIQQIRWGDRLSYIIDVDEYVKTLYIPRLTLQPFIENALIHGFHGRKSGHIKLSIRQHDRDLECCIEDNGGGLRADWKELKQGNTGGYGLRNVKERIEAYFGTPYGVELTSVNGQGTQVRIQLPQLQTKDEVKERYHVENTDN